MKVFKITEACKYLGVCINTLKKLEEKQFIKSFRTPGGHRRFLKENLDEYMGIKAKGEAVK